MTNGLASMHKQASSPEEKESAEKVRETKFCERNFGCDNFLTSLFVVVVVVVAGLALSVLRDVRQGDAHERAEDGAVQRGRQELGRVREVQE